MTRRFLAAASHVALLLALSTPASADTPVDVLYSFPATTGAGNPLSPLTLVGSTLYGGTNQSLYAFPVGGSTITTLHTFNTPTEGDELYTGVTAIGSTLYGTASLGGPFGGGTLYSIGADGSNFTVMESFGGSEEPTGGQWPVQPLAVIETTLYTTTSFGGANHNGAVIGFGTTTSALSVVAPLPAGDNPGISLGPLVDVGNTLYGTAVGTRSTGGSIYSVNTDGTGYATLYTIPGSGGLESCTLTLVGSTLYGVGGGAEFGVGEIFSMNLDGSDFTVLHSFAGTNDDGTFGTMTLVGSTLYGTSWDGGADSDGTIFSFNTATDTFTLLHTFTGTDGTYPQGVTLVGSTLYGTTYGGGANGAGVIFAFPTPEPSSLVLAIAALPAGALLGRQAMARRTRRCRS